MSDFTPCPKPHRIVDPRALEEAHRPYCEVCGRPGPTQSHHIIPKAAGGPDIPENLIALCPACHRDAHTERITRNDLWKVRAKADGRDIKEIRTACIDSRRAAHRGE